MHILMFILLILGAVMMLVVGLVGVVRDLLVRGPHDVPLLDGDESTRAGRFDDLPPHA